MSRFHPIELLGETLHVLPSQTLYWPKQQTLILADPHFGKAETFRHAAIPVPDVLEQQLQRLNETLRSNDVKRLVILGDFWHSKTGRTKAILESLQWWREQWIYLNIEIVQGNHDHGNLPPEGWCDRWYEWSPDDLPFVFSHYPEPYELGYTLAGHLHPAVTLLGPGRQRLKLPCFWFGSQVGVLPAFGNFTGTAAIRPRAGTESS